MSAARASPFHVRMAEHNAANAWVTRGAFTLAARFGDAREEALAARFSAVMIDVSAMARLRVHGQGAAKLLSAACATDIEALAPGGSARIVWRADGGGVRGAGIVARFGASNFTLASFDTDGAWFEVAARRFDTVVRDETCEKGMLLLAGPVAPGILAAAGLDNATHLEPGRHAVQSWRGLTVTVSRWTALANDFGGYEIGCTNDDAVMVFDRLWQAGQSLGLVLAGQEALETLLLEQGVPIPGVDFAPAHEANAREPSPVSLGFGNLVGKNGEAPSRLLAGLELEAETPLAFAPVVQGGAIVGMTLRSAYSPMLRRAIALAQLDAAQSSIGTAVAVRHLTPRGTEEMPARVTSLPFLKSIA